MTEFQVVLEGGYFYEGPRWRDGRLWFSDFFGHHVQSIGPAGDMRVEAEFPGRPSGLGWLPNGRLLIASMLDRRILRREPSGELTVHADVSRLAGRGVINDMIVNESGHAYVGCMGFDPLAGQPISAAPLVHVAPDGTADVGAAEMYMPNGMVILPGDVLVVGETLGHRLTAFDMHPDGSLANRRAWATFGPRPETTDVIAAMAAMTVGPDGSAADAEGMIWVADAYRNRIIRVEQGGRIVAEVSTGDAGAYAVAFGGPDGSTLFICSAPDFDFRARAARAEARLLAIRVDVPGIAFAGPPQVSAEIDARRE
jgi:sugar lactone lactonase YvrE